MSQLGHFGQLFLVVLPTACTAVPVQAAATAVSNAAKRV